MPTYSVATDETKVMMNDLLFDFANADKGIYQEIIDNRVNIQILMAHGDRDDQGNLTGNAITHNGCKALGLCSIVSLKNRVAGMGDVLIQLDHDYWETAGDKKRRSLLDHEIYHIDFKREKDGVAVKRDDIQRPLIRMRPHDVEYGWFASIAARHGDHSTERIQAKGVMDEFGQFFFPEFALRD